MKHQHLDTALLVLTCSRKAEHPRQSDRGIDEGMFGVYSKKRSDMLRCGDSRLGFDLEKVGQDRVMSFSI